MKCKLLTAQEAMARLRIGRSTVWKWVAERKLTTVKLYGRTLFPEADIEALIQRRTRGAIA